MSKWKVTCNYINGEKYFRAYRLIDEQEVDHSGNREYSGSYTKNRAEAEAIAEKLNSQEIENG